MKVKSYYLIAILFCLLSGCDLDDSSLPSNKAKILFISARIENRPDWNLLSMNWDGSDQHKITELLVRCDKPVVSHSGKMVLFVHYTDDFDYELYLVNVDGTNLTLIDKANRYCGSADWSFDDQKIIYSKNRDETTEEKDLILYDVASKTRHILTSVGDNALGRFSPDHQIAYCHHSENGSYDIYVMQIDGAQNQKLVSNATCPVWSPDGQKIAYQSSIDNGSAQIFVVNKDGTNAKQLTSTFSSRLWPGWPQDGNYDPQWTPDGKRIVYVSWEDENPEIFKMNSDGSNKVRLTNADKRDENPEISSDGKYILFTSNRNMEMNAEIFIMDMEGRNQRSLSNYEGSDIYPVEIR